MAGSGAGRPPCAMAENGAEGAAMDSQKYTVKSGKDVDKKAINGYNEDKYSWKGIGNLYG